MVILQNNTLLSEISNRVADAANYMSFGHVVWRSYNLLISNLFKKKTQKKTVCKLISTFIDYI